MGENASTEIMGKPVVLPDGPFAGWTTWGLGADPYETAIGPFCFRLDGESVRCAFIPRRDPLPNPPRVKLPISVALPPLMGGLGYDTLDVFEEAAYRLDPMDMDQVQDID